MQLSFLKTLFIIGTLAGVVLADGGSYHRYGYKHKGNGVIKRTILIDGCTGKPIREKPYQPEITNNGGGGISIDDGNTGAINNNPAARSPPPPPPTNRPNTLADYGLEQYEDEIKDLARQLGIPDTGL